MNSYRGENKGRIKCFDYLYDNNNDEDGTSW